MIPIEVARKLVAAAPPPAGTEWSIRAGQVSRAIVKGLATTAKAIAKTPLYVGHAAALAVAADPVVFGALPIDDGADSEMAAWFVLAEWDYATTAARVEDGTILDRLFKTWGV